jgi:hypothetical protein
MPSRPRWTHSSSDRRFTKTANCWGVNNMAKGANTNRIVLFRREP